MNIEYRIALEADIEDILQMMADFYAIDCYHFDAGLARLNRHQFISNKQLGKLWIIEVDENTIGYIALTFGFSFEFKGNTAFIDELYLKNSYRGKGLGSEIMDFIYQQAQCLHIKALHLEVEKHNTKGNKLYLKKGFKEHNRVLMTKFVNV